MKRRRQVLRVVGRIVGRLLMFLSRQVLRTNVSHMNLKEEKLILSQAGTWDLGPFGAVLAPGQTSPQAAEYKLEGTKNSAPEELMLLNWFWPAPCLWSPHPPHTRTQGFRGPSG